MMLLRANGIIQDYADRRVLDSVDINIYDGDRIGLVGENGAGKSTLMKILAGRLNPDEGSVKCDCPVALVEQFGAGGDDAITGEMSSRFNAQENRSGLSGGECTRRRIAQALGA
ncbi:MAG: ATP-binding cassette domain-containing protein, partial [Clostridiales bacterium]|nr:ATP-binding cassette domain-containing protein [Clostridiales bacterium]